MSFELKLLRDTVYFTDPIHLYGFRAIFEYYHSRYNINLDDLMG